MITTVPMCSVVHFEMPYKDRQRAAHFYAAAFGWTHQMLGPEMGRCPELSCRLEPVVTKIMLPS